MSRRLRPAIELVSAIGSLGFDLQHHSDEQIAEAVRVLRTVNPQMFEWLVRVLDQREARTHSHETGRCTRCDYPEAQGHKPTCIHFEYWQRFHSSRGVDEPRADAAVDPIVATERKEGATRDETS